MFDCFNEKATNMRSKSFVKSLKRNCSYNKIEETDEELECEKEESFLAKSVNRKSKLKAMPLDSFPRVISKTFKKNRSKEIIVSSEEVIAEESDFKDICDFFGTSPRVRVMKDYKEDSTINQSNSHLTHYSVNLKLNNVIDEVFEDELESEEHSFFGHYKSFSHLDKTECYEEIMMFKNFNYDCEPILEENFEEDDLSDKNRSHNRFKLPLIDEFALFKDLKKKKMTNFDFILEEENISERS